MIDVYYWPTPNGHKVTIFLEEAAVPYKLVPVNIRAGEQFRPSFLAISPNNRMPAIVDTAPAANKEPLSVCESGAILLYLAKKTGRFLPTDEQKQFAAIQWLFWQMSSLGPMSGQAIFFTHHAPEKTQYAVDRYTNEVQRLYGVLNKQLANRPFIVGEYSIADMACYPWMVSHERLGLNITEFSDLKRWFDQMKGRPAVERAYALASQFHVDTVMSEDAKKIMYGQTAAALGLVGKSA